MEELLKALVVLGALAQASTGAAQPLLPVDAGLVAHTCDEGQAEPSRDSESPETDLVSSIVSTSGIASGADDDHVYFQLSLAADPRTGVGTCADDGFFHDARWGVLLDLDADPSTSEVGLLLEGQGPARGVRLHTNSTTTLADSTLDPLDAVAATTYSACTNADVKAEADGTYTLTLAVERDDLLAAANEVLSPDLFSLTGDFTATGVTGSGSAGFGEDVTCFDGDVQGALCASGQPCPPLSQVLSGPLVVDTFVDVHVTNDSTFGSATPTIAGLAEVGATLEVSDGSHTGTATVTDDGRFSFEVPESWGWKKGDSVSLQVTATDPELHSESVQLDASVGTLKVAVAQPGVGGLLDSLLAPVEITTNAPVGSLVTVRADTGSGKTVTVCSGVTLVGGLFLCVPVEGSLHDGAGGTLTATVSPLLGGSASGATSFLVDLLDVKPTGLQVTADARPTFSGESDASDGSVVEVRVDDELVCTTTVLAGAFHCTPSQDVLNAEGAHLLEIEVQSGVSDAVAQYTGEIELDRSLPSLNLLGPVNGTTSASGDFLVTGTAADLHLADTAHITVTGDSEGVVFDDEVDLVGGTFNLPLTDLVDDTYTVVVEVLDLVGNLVSVDVEVVIDSSATAVHIDSPVANAVLPVSMPSFSGSTGATLGTVVVHSENGTLLCSTTVQAGMLWQCTAEASMGDGAHSATVSIDDGLNPVGSASVAFVIDTTDPLIATDDPAPNGCPLGSSVRVTGSLMDGTAMVAQVSLVDASGTVAFGPVMASVQGTAFAANLKGVAPGTWTLRVDATDAAGNTSRDESQSAVVTGAAEALSVTSPGPWSASPALAVRGTTLACPGSDIQVTTQVGSIEVLLCSAEVQDDGSFRCDVGDGLLSIGMEYELGLQLNDGVHAPANTTVSVSIDGEAPDVTILSPVHRAMLDTSRVTIEGTVSDDMGSPRVFVTLRRVDDSSLLLDAAEAAVSANGSWKLAESGIPSGVLHAVEVLARDEAGNEGSDGPREFSIAGGGTSGVSTTGGSIGATSGGTGGTTGGGDTGVASGGTTDADGESQVVRAGNSIFGCSAGGSGTSGAWLAVLVLLALRGRRWATSGVCTWR